jgi:outer membrane protein
LQAYKESYQAYEVSADASNKSYEKQLEFYRLGQGSLIDLNIENQRNVRAQSEKIQAKYTLLFQTIVLDYYLGLL